MNTLKENVSNTVSTAKNRSNKLRILVVCHAYVTGVNQGKLDAIAATGAAEVALLVPSTWKAMGWGKVKELERPYTSITLYPANIMFSGRVGAYFYWPWKVWQVINDFQPDVIHVEQEVFSVSALELAFFARIFKKPISVFGWENMERKLSPFREWIRQYVFDSSQLMIPGNKDGEKLLSKWGYTGKIEVMPQIGVDTKLFPSEIRQGHDGELKIGFMGRLVPQKGIDLLFTAAQQLRGRGHTIQVVICGSGVEEEALKAKAAELDIEDLVIWRSGISHAEVPKEMRKFDVLVLPSRTIDTWKEQFGHVLIEAMSMGIPVIGSDSGEIPNVIGDPALVFPEEDADSLAQILERVSCNSSWYTELSQYSIDRVNQLYSHERIAQRLIDLWREMCDKA
ncbi:MAG: glycosyltransferase family 4 protein [Leptolyngbya sp. SIO3F4]|nr:glycosyltransferase family 4 protein [Leptolyngbya sp. SIO3F4]